MHRLSACQEAYGAQSRATIICNTVTAPPLAGRPTSSCSQDEVGGSGMMMHGHQVAAHRDAFATLVFLIERLLSEVKWTMAPV